ncbi:hypothetical protein TWF569_008761 [Orbilia oligospora]|uniref:Uncharacterized protein n=1 Tax=Orbilia oligospora TaxID=2813651 RepID=A0A7C8NFK4_ORBOL|nr:hypothetical protein TWF706_011987 [Orbilia oligospora]KAF3097294.1 hypothetical protein TWF103_009587 [Orbilia oligospora]KAF3103140.1 hypothetical protein TWF102_003956 [Orbilia oligospora]KAF3138660.1 hypothetical protein TWF569_008761 [Orbilia oligospora]
MMSFGVDTKFRALEKLTRKFLVPAPHLIPPLGPVSSINLDGFSDSGYTSHWKKIFFEITWAYQLISLHATYSCRQPISISPVPPRYSPTGTNVENPYAVRVSVFSSMARRTAAFAFAQNSFFSLHLLGLFVHCCVFL